MADVASQGAKAARSMKELFIGPWAKKPRDEQERRGAKIARAAVKVTASGSLVSPVAVAVVDILGMTDLLNRMPLDEIAKKIAEPFFDGPRRRAGLHDPGVTRHQLMKLGFREGAATFAAMIGDMMILCRRPEWEEGDTVFAAAAAVSWLAQSTCKAISFNSRLGIWLRAAIAYGECIISAAGHDVMLGLPVREAIHWERRQEWIGGMLTSSATETLRAAVTKAKLANGPGFVATGSNFLVNYEVPLKACPEHPPPRPLIALNWTSIFGTEFLLGHSEPPMPEPPPPPPVRRKIENTIAFCRAFKDSGLTSILEF